jgi:hypothetical protein
VQDEHSKHSNWEKSRVRHLPLWFPLAPIKYLLFLKEETLVILAI